MKLHTDNLRGHLCWQWWCPGCNCEHRVSSKIHTQSGTPEAPTFTPSLLQSRVVRDGKTVVPQCHAWMTDGRVKYLSDSDHALAGKTVDVPEYTGPVPG